MIASAARATTLVVVVVVFVVVVVLAIHGVLSVNKTTVTALLFCDNEYMC